MRLVAALLSVGGLLAVSSPPATAEIVFLEGGEVASADAQYAYQHPSLRSVVFLTPETRQMAILPPVVMVVPPPPLLWRSPTSMPIYPPVQILGGFNQPVRPSNQDMNNYTLERAHGFSQEVYYKNNGNRLSLGGSGSPYFYGYGYGYSGYGIPYPPAQPAGFNQPARPSNRDMNNYNLQRAHRFSTDSYK